MKRGNTPKAGENLIIPGRNFRRILTELISIGLVTVGVLLWFWPLEILRTQQGNLLQTGSFSSMLLYIFFASQLTTVGVAFYAYSLYSRKTKENTEDIESTLDQLEAFLEKSAKPGKPLPRLDLASLRGAAAPSRFTRMHLLAFVEGLFALLLYGWLVAEYDANTFMQTWVRVNVPWVAYLLNEAVLLVLAGLFVGFLLSQLKVFGKLRRLPKVFG